MGIRGVPLTLFQSYLSNRKLCLYCNDIYSSVKLTDKGVPQGSLLGPIFFFLVYINDIVNSSSILDYTVHADDPTLLKGKHINTLHVFFQNRFLKQLFPTVYLTDESITQVNSTKVVGVKVDENLN